MTAATGRDHDAEAATPARRVGGVVADVLLTLAAIGGVACLVLVALAAVFDVTLMMFRTGSMAPTIPAGSVAVVREVPASTVEVGDVVTVDRPGDLPVTHRVTSVSPGSAADERVLTMRGDANENDDPHPYPVTRVRTVLLSVPALAPVIVFLSQPVLLGGITLAAAALVGWAFWPRGAAPARKRRRTPKHAAGVVAVIGAVGLLAAGPAPAAHAAGTRSTEVIEGRHLTLISVTDTSAMSGMTPGEAARWDVGVTADPPEPGIVTVSLSGTGTLGLVVDVRACSARWVGEDCPGTLTSLAEARPVPLDGASTELLQMPSSADRWLRLHVLLPASATPEPGASTEVRVRATGAGDTVVTGPDVRLPPTGFGVAWAAVLAVGAVVTGALVAGVARRRLPEGETS